MTTNNTVKDKKQQCEYWSHGELMKRVLPSGDAGICCTKQAAKYAYLYGNTYRICKDHYHKITNS